MMKKSFRPLRPISVDCKRGQGPADAIWQMYLMIWRDYEDHLGDDRTPADGLLDVLEALIMGCEPRACRDLLAKAQLVAHNHWRENSSPGASAWNRGGEKVNEARGAVEQSLSALLDDLTAMSSVESGFEDFIYAGDLEVTLKMRSDRHGSPIAHLAHMLHILETKFLNKPIKAKCGSEEEERAMKDFHAMMDLASIVEELIASINPECSSDRRTKARLARKNLKDGRDDSSILLSFLHDAEQAMDETRRTEH